MLMNISSLRIRCWNVAKGEFQSVTKYIHLNIHLNGFEPLDFAVACLRSQVNY